MKPVAKLNVRLSRHWREVRILTALSSRAALDGEGSRSWKFWDQETEINPDALRVTFRGSDLRVTFLDQ
jgi:hypothetical protein